MSGPFQQQFSALPVHLKTIMGNWGITPTPDGAGFLKEMWSTNDQRKRAIKHVIHAYPQCVTSHRDRHQVKTMIIDKMDRLAAAASNSKNLSHMTKSESAYYTQNMAQSSTPRPAIPAFLMHKWRRITPTRISKMEPTTMRQL